jgi:hypothetical protein
VYREKDEFISVSYKPTDEYIKAYPGTAMNEEKRWILNLKKHNTLPSGSWGGTG